jgi:hypothetical protein
MRAIGLCACAGPFRFQTNLRWLRLTTPAIDILFTDPTPPEDDRMLAGAIDRARNVILGAELVDRSAYGSQSQWMKPLPALFEESDDAGDLIAPARRIHARGRSARQRAEHFFD